MKRMLPEEYAVGIIVMIMVCFVAAQVVSRYFLHVSLSHTEEIVRYMFVWATMLGMSAAARKGRHFSISSGRNDRTGLFSSISRVTVGASSVCFALLLIVWGMRVALIQFASSQKTAALGFPMWIVGLSIPLGGILLLVRLVQSFRDDGRAH